MSSFVVTQLAGGLGNQMFQYAAGRAVALAHGCDLLVDTHDLSAAWTSRAYGLQRAFRVTAKPVSAAITKRVLGWRAPLRGALRRLARLGLAGREIVVEPHFAYWAGIRSTEPPCYLIGYWQSERYFADVVQQIRTELVFQDALVDANAQMRDRIRSSVAVSVHVRRGDYVKNRKINAFHGVCPTDYYERAIAYIREKAPTASFFVFSDDLEWARTNLPLPRDTQFVSGNSGANGHHDMHLMSLCRHHILANSTFSWWGAWLSTAPDKLVVAPKAWFADRSVDTSTLFPKGWELL
jgi:Glycosyl transferase family 11